MKHLTQVQRLGLIVAAMAATMAVGVPQASADYRAYQCDVEAGGYFNIARAEGSLNCTEAGVPGTSTGTFTLSWSSWGCEPAVDEVSSIWVTINGRTYYGSGNTTVAGTAVKWVSRGPANFEGSGLLRLDDPYLVIVPHPELCYGIWAEHPPKTTIADGSFTVAGWGY